MKFSSPYANDPRYRRDWSLLWLIAILGTVLVALHAVALFRYGWTMFSNDGPYGAMVTQQSELSINTWGRGQDWFIPAYIVTCYSIIALELAWAWWTRGSYILSEE